MSCIVKRHRDMNERLRLKCPIWTECAYEGMPPGNGYFLVEGSQYLTFNKDYWNLQKSDVIHYPTLEYSFHALLELNSCIEEIMDDKMSLLSSFPIQIRFLCCSDTDTKDKHEREFENLNIDKESIFKCIKRDDLYYEYGDIKRWVYLSGDSYDFTSIVQV